MPSERRPSRPARAGFKDDSCRRRFHRDLLAEAVPEGRLAAAHRSSFAFGSLFTFLQARFATAGLQPASKCAERREALEFTRRSDP